MAKLVYCALVAVFLCVPSRAQVYTVRVPEGVERVEWFAAAGPGWDVAVSYDPDTCEIYCTYRRSRDVFGKMALLPPITTLHVYAGPMAPVVIVVDPSGVGSPRLSAATPRIPDDCCIAAKRPARQLYVTLNRTAVQHRASRPTSPRPARLTTHLRI